MNKGICLGCLPKDLSVEDKMALAKDAGFDGVEIASPADRAAAARMKVSADAAGLEIPSIMSSAHWRCPLSDPDPKVRQECMDTVCRDLECAADIAADTVLLVPGVVNDKVCYEAAYATSHACVKELAACAEANRVCIGVENVWNKLLLSPIEFCQYVDDVGSDYVQAYFDCGNILLYGYPQHWIRTLGSRIKKVHVKDFRLSDKAFVGLLEGDVPYGQVIQALRDVGYDSYLTVEVGCQDESKVRAASEAVDRIIAGA